MKAPEERHLCRSEPGISQAPQERKIPLEISITSNVITGSVDGFEAHPVRRLYDAGVPIILNTDDPAMFDTTLNDEYFLAAQRFGFTEAELRGLAEASLRWGFR